MRKAWYLRIPELEEQCGERYIYRVILAKNNMSGSRVELKNIKGYFTAIPVHWTEGENNLLPYNMRLIASNDVRKDDEYQIADNRTINGFEGDLS